MIKALRSTFGLSEPLDKKYLSQLSFNLSTSLKNMVGFAELIYNGRLGVISTQQKEFLGDVLSCAQQMQILVGELDSSQKVTVELLTDLSFKVRTLLDGIIGFSTLINDGKIGEVSPGVKESLNHILLNSNDILRLVSEISAHSELIARSTLFVTSTKISFNLRTTLNNVSGFAELILSEKLGNITNEQKALFRDILTSSNKLSSYLAKNIEGSRHISTERLFDFSFRLRTELYNIIGFSQIMYDGKIGLLSDKNKEYLEYIISSSDATLALANDITAHIEVEDKINPPTMLMF